MYCLHRCGDGFVCTEHHTSLIGSVHQPAHDPEQRLLYFCTGAQAVYVALLITAVSLVLVYALKKNELCDSSLANGTLGMREALTRFD